MHNQRLSKTPSSINTNSQAAEQNPQLAYKPFGSQIQKASAAPVTQSTKEDVAFAEQKMEAFGLELQAKYGKITPEGQERLTVLQAKMASFSSSQLEHARRYSHNIANIPLRRPDTAIPIQAKLTIGELGDKYEQEADETARQVVQRIHQPQSEKIQRESLPENDELQMKPERPVHREALLEDNQMQMKPMVQRRALDAGIVASANLERSIQQAQGSGQPLADSIKSPMEQAFGADFSRVKVHTDTQADQLNRSIQAKAFTTGQDVFFRQGAYEPGSRGGQELIAHELTHVVQQKGGAVLQRAHYTSGDPIYMEDDDPNSELLDDNFDDTIKGQLQQPTADGTVEQAVNAGTNVDVVLWRSTTRASVDAIRAANSAGGAAVQIDAPAPGHQQKQDQIAVGGVSPEYTASPNVTGFSWRHWLVVVKINTRYLTRGSATESGWICSTAAPVVVLDTVDRTMGLPEPPGFGAA